MKVSKIFTVDVEIAEKLKKEHNASALVNELLDKHYSMNVLEQLSPEDIKEVRRLNDIAMKANKELKVKYGI